MERGSSHQGRGTPAERAQERTRDVSTSQGGVYLDIEKTAWSPIPKDLATEGWILRFEDRKFVLWIRDYGPKSLLTINNFSNGSALLRIYVLSNEDYWYRKPSKDGVD